MNTFVTHATEILLLVFLSITFLQSGLDKLFNYTGNLQWLQGHFSKSPLKRMVPALLMVLTLTELLAGILCVAGIIQLLAASGTQWALWGSITSCIALLMLLFGQRLAQDYAGAQTIVIYFVPAVFLVFLLQP
jgi:uncharacterized membrane protein YphA (DoxX/SURF4 family)